MLSGGVTTPPLLIMCDYEFAITDVARVVLSVWNQNSHLALGADDIATKGEDHSFVLCPVVQWIDMEHHSVSREMNFKGWDLVTCCKHTCG